MTRIGKSAHCLEGILAGHARAFREVFGPADPLRLFFAPGRVNLMGAHLDYSGGPVMPMAIDRGTFLALRPRSDQELNLRSTLEDSTSSFDLGALPEAPLGSWVDYPLGVVRELVEWAPPSRPGLDVLFGGNLAVGAGLSSSASICVGTALALDRIWELGLEPLERVDAALHAERDFVGVRCGIMDPYAVGLARPRRLLWLDCKDASYSHLRIDLDRLALAVADTGVRRELAASAFNQRVSECGFIFRYLREFQPEATCLRDIRFETFEAHGHLLDAHLQRRARHVLGEVERTFAARDALRDGRTADFGGAMVEAHRSLRDLYEVSVPELDQLVEDAVSIDGVHGSRLTGAGFGGCTVTLLERWAMDELKAKLIEGFRRRFGVEPEIDFFLGDEGPREVG